MAFDAQRFGRNVAAARARLGLKPKELAVRMGVNAATIYRIERGERTDIGRPQLEALARALDTTPEELVDDRLRSGVPSDELEDRAAHRHDEIIGRLDAIDEQLRVLATAGDRERRA